MDNSVESEGSEDSGDDIRLDHLPKSSMTAFNKSSRTKAAAAQNKDQEFEMKFSPERGSDGSEQDSGMEYFHKNMLFKKSKQQRLQRHKKLLEQNVPGSGGQQPERTNGFAVLTGKQERAKPPKYKNDNIHEYLDQQYLN